MAEPVGHRAARAVSRAALVGAIALRALAPSEARAATAYDWPQFNGDARHSGYNQRETILSASNVASLKQLFQVTLPAVADSAPAVLTAVSTSSGLRDLLFINTKTGELIALDAHTGTTVWASQHAGTGCSGPAGPCVTESSPAIDPGRAFIYSYGLDGAVHRNAVTTGAETSGGGWPEVATLKPDVEKGASPLTVATSPAGVSYLYVANGAHYGDAGDYQGHVTTIRLSNGAQHVFNSLCSDLSAHFVESGSPDCPSPGSGIWGRAGVVYDSDLDTILVATGNGPFDPAQNHWADSVLMLTLGGTGSGSAPLDSYTPSSFLALQNADADLGSSSPAILPTPPGFPYPHLALQAGKDGFLRLLNLDNMSNQGSGRQAGRSGGELASISVPPSQNRVLTALAAWVNPTDGSTWAFVSSGGGTAGLQLAANGTSVTMRTMWTNASAPGSSPLVANGVVYVAGPNHIDALAGGSGALLWQGSIGGIHWESPVVANGILYIADESAHLTAFSVPGTLPPPVPAVPSRGLWFAAAALLAGGLMAGRRLIARGFRAERRANVA
jgi:hypothetical protein